VFHPPPLHLRSAPTASNPTPISAFRVFYQITSSLRYWKSGLIRKANPNSISNGLISGEAWIGVANEIHDRLNTEMLINDPNQTKRNSDDLFVHNQHWTTMHVWASDLEKQPINLLPYNSSSGASQIAHAKTVALGAGVIMSDHLVFLPKPTNPNSATTLILRAPTSARHGPFTHRFRASFFTAVLRLQLKLKHLLFLCCGND
jgi:hypothetical protein